jgi:hypothetical protein
LGLRYFQLGLACPFLEDESCSIHANRPVACREYLVTSPAEACAQPAGGAVRDVPLPANVGRAARAMDQQASGSTAGWVPLIFALEWAEAHPDEPAPRPGPVLLQELFARLLEADAGLDALAGWVPESGLRPFLTALGWAVGYGVGTADWEAIAAGLRESDSLASQWYLHEFPGRYHARVQLARVQGTSVVRLRAQVPAEVKPQIRLAVAIFQQFRLQGESA